MVPLKSYRLFSYFGLLPFLIFTYQTWCGPIEHVHQFTRMFIAFSTCTLVFIGGCWWGISYTQSEEVKFKMMVIGLTFALTCALGVTAMIALGGKPFMVISLGLAHFLIWLLEFFIPKVPIKHNYRVQRTVLTMTIVVCHMLVATQFIDNQI